MRRATSLYHSREEIHEPRQATQEGSTIGQRVLGRRSRGEVEAKPLQEV